MKQGAARQIYPAWARVTQTMICFCALCLFITIIGVATLAARLGKPVLKRLEHLALELRLKISPASRKLGFVG
ncbi:MAG: hypothetical protein N2423_06840 [Novosphingobium sp.]|nr:hypothetical protein [Novosphingobium sp.]